MDQLLEEVHQIALTVYSKIQSLVKDAPPGSLQLTGLLGVAALLAGLYHLRQSRERRGRQPGVQVPNPPHRLEVNRGPPGFGKSGSSPSSEGPGSAGQVYPVPLNELRSQLIGIRTVTLSAPGVLLEERDPRQLEEGATVRPDAAEIVKEMASSVQTYIMAEVCSDVGEAVVRGALESAGVLGHGRRQIPPHRLILCDTLKGKVSVVRQIEPELHIDAAYETIEELQRFIPQQIHIYQPGGVLANCTTGSVGHDVSLAEALNVSV